jgi:autotransporter-associated beta strand protein
LTVAGNFTLAPITTATASTNVTLTGATGALTVNGPSFQVGQTATTAGAPSIQSLDMSGLGTLTANLGASGIFRMGSNPSTTFGPATTVVKLAANSTITANVIGVGDNTGKSGSYTLKLGSTANTLNANTISIGSQNAGVRSNGELSFETGTGTLKLRAADGTSAVTAMNLINSGLTGSANFISTANFAGHDVDAKITTLTMGRRSGAGAVASANATFTFDTGILEVGTLNLGEIANATYNSGTINATMNIGGGTATFGAINMATSNSLAGTTINSTLNFTGGTTTVNGAITKGGGGSGTTTANLNLNGAAAILDMTSGNLTNLTTITYTDGLLKNLSVVNTGMTLAGTGSRVFDQATGVSGEIQGAITGSGIGLTKDGVGSLTLSGANTYTGATTISAGTLQIGSGGSTGSLSTSSAITNNGTLVFSRNNTITQGTDFASVIAGTGNVIKGGSGTLVLSGANTYAGATTISAGTLTVSGGSAIEDTGAVSVSSGAVFNLIASETIGSIAGAGNVTLGANTLTTGSDNSSTTLSGVLSGASGALTKDGTGTLTLSGANTYTGTTTVNSGTLTAAAAGAAGGTSQVVLNEGGSVLVTADNAVNDSAAINLNGGRMALSGNFNETVGLLTLSANSTLDFSGFGGTLRFGGIGSWATGANLAIWNWSGTTQYGTQVNNYANPSNLVFTNNSTLTSNLANISFYSDSGNSFVGNGFDRGFSGGGTEIIAVPEPGSYVTALMLLLACLAVQSIRRRAKQKPLEGSSSLMTQVSSPEGANYSQTLPRS